jgi:hypothetical protein
MAKIQKLSLMDCIWGDHQSMIFSSGEDQVIARVPNAPDQTQVVDTLSNR